MADFDERALRNAMGNFCTGVIVANGIADDAPVGFAAQSFVSLSLDPPLVALCPAKQSSSWPKLRDSGSFCISKSCISQGKAVHTQQSFVQVRGLAGFVRAPPLGSGRLHCHTTHAEQ